ncbi:MAG: substrate-binding domain-containing protein, partial [Micromonosporaceae bacterium]|nr:substrate-binding domain-containing protein [Micromonosporaceae bacterium]
MGEVPTVGILSPFLGGPYYGGILAAIGHLTHQAGGRAIAIETIDAGSDPDTKPRPEFRPHVAWQHVNGFIAITDAVRSDYLRAFRATGRPVVVISHEYPDLEAPVIIPDNASGIRQAVEHLLDHGHTRIGFAGHLDVHDVQERHQAYAETLASHGIEPDPALCFRIANNRVAGGEHVAAEMVEAGMPMTAVVVATDANAIGLIRKLGTLGIGVPDQLAVVSFDDMEEATYAIPSLSSVKQPFSMLGTRAYELLDAQLHGQEVPAGRYTVPTSFIVRESCGCVRGGQLAPCDWPGESREALSLRLAALLDPSGCLQDDSALAEVVDVIATVLETTAAGLRAPVPTRFHHALLSLYDRTMLRASMEEIGEVIQKFALGLVHTTSARAAMEQPIREIILKIAQARARGQFGDSAYF